MGQKVRKCETAVDDKHRHPASYQVMAFGMLLSGNCGLADAQPFIGTTAFE